MLEGSYRPISVTVTPCSSDVTLEWKISHSSFQNAGSPGYTSGKHQYLKNDNNNKINVIILRREGCSIKKIAF